MAACESITTLWLFGASDRNPGTGRAGGYAKIKVMKVPLPHPEHESYLRHRRQNVTQVLLPVILAAALITAGGIGLIFATFRGGGDVTRWGEISAIWILLPLMFAALVFTALLAGLVYAMDRLLKVLPGYTGKAQDLAYRLEGMARRALDVIVKPVFAVDEIGTTLKALIGRK